MMKTQKVDIVEFLKTVRTMKSYMQILQGLNLQEEERELTNKAVLEVMETLRGYMKEGSNDGPM